MYSKVFLFFLTGVLTLEYYFCVELIYNDYNACPAGVCHTNPGDACGVCLQCDTYSYPCGCCGCCRCNPCKDGTNATEECVCREGCPDFKVGDHCEFECFGGCKQCILGYGPRCLDKCTEACMEHTNQKCDLYHGGIVCLGCMKISDRGPITFNCDFPFDGATSSNTLVLTIVLPTGIVAGVSVACLFLYKYRKNKTSREGERKMLVEEGNETDSFEVSGRRE